MGEEARSTLGGIVGSGFVLNGNASTIEGLQALINSSDSDSNVRTLQTPTIVVSHNEEGTINVSESRPIITSSSSTLDSNNTNVRSNVEFRDIGTKLTVTPLIGADGTVQMTIEQTVDSITSNTTIDGNEQPIIGRREATSTITVNSGEVIVLGGLQENEKILSNAYFPVLGKLPILGQIFGGNSEQYVRRDLVIFIRPLVLRRPNEALTMSQEKLEKIKGGSEVIKYIETGTTDDIYMEGSTFESEESEPEPYIKLSLPEWLK